MRKERGIDMNINLTVDYAEGLYMLASSLREDIKDSKSTTEAWKKIDKFYKDVESMRNRQKCTGSKSFSIMENDIGEGHTKYLQGLNLPIMLNTIWETNESCSPSNVSEMHIGYVGEKLALLITPARITLPQDE